MLNLNQLNKLKSSLLFGLRLVKTNGGYDSINASIKIVDEQIRDYRMTTFELRNIKKALTIALFKCEPGNKSMVIEALRVINRDLDLKIMNPSTGKPYPEFDVNGIEVIEK